MPDRLGCGQVLHREVVQLSQLLQSIPFTGHDAGPQISSCNFELEWTLAAPQDQSGAAFWLPVLQDFLKVLCVLFSVISQRSHLASFRGG